MIHLEHLIRAINESVTGASKALRAQNLEILDQFFEEDSESAELDSLADEVNAISAQAQEAEDPDLAMAAVQKAAAALDAAARTMQGEGNSFLRPKMVRMKYPHLTSKGPEVHTVTVPLIALTSISAYQLSELKFSTELEVELVGDELQVSFPQRTDNGAVAPSKGGARATLEVTIDATQPPRGVEMLVEGYERVLRAQIPG